MPDPIKLTKNYWTYADIEKVGNKYKVIFTGMIHGEFGERLLKIKEIEKMWFDSIQQATEKLKEFNNG